ncbi:MAG: response regulator [Deltaproteobacteria bacterium]|nr:response regulator [Deltaproteobacteria bacterium]
MARFCGVTPQAVRLWVSGGLLKAVRTAGDHYRIRRADLEDFMRSRGIKVPEEVAAEKPVVVLIDDDAEISKNLKRTLAKIGFDLVTYTSAYEALLALPVKVPVIVLFDLSMPGIDGLAALRALKANPTTATIPIVVLTSHGHLRHQAIESGAVTVVLKNDLSRVPNVVQEYRIRRSSVQGRGVEVRI